MGVNIDDIKTRADIDAMMDPLLIFMENQAPEEQRDRFRWMIKTTAGHMQRASRNLLVTRVIAIVLGILYLLK